MTLRELSARVDARRAESWERLAWLCLIVAQSNAERPQRLTLAMFNLYEQASLTIHGSTTVRGLFTMITGQEFDDG